MIFTLTQEQIENFPARLTLPSSSKRLSEEDYLYGVRYCPRGRTYVKVYVEGSEKKPRYYQLKKLEEMGIVSTNIPT